MQVEELQWRIKNKLDLPPTQVYQQQLQQQQNGGSSNPCSPIHGSSSLSRPSSSSSSTSTSRPNSLPQTLIQTNGVLGMKQNCQNNILRNNNNVKPAECGGGGVVANGGGQQQQQQQQQLLEEGVVLRYVAIAIEFGFDPGSREWLTCPSELDILRCRMEDQSLIEGWETGIP